MKIKKKKIKSLGPIARQSKLDIKSMIHKGKINKLDLIRIKMFALWQTLLTEDEKTSYWVWENTCKLYSPQTSICNIQGVPPLPNVYIYTLKAANTIFSPFQI